MLESLPGRDVTAACDDAGIALAEFDTARATFLRAGLEALGSAELSGAWSQVNLPLDSLGVTWMQMVRADFQDWLGRWLASDAEHRFYYLHKPPGARLRFAGGDTEFRARLAAALDDIVGGRDTWNFAAYDAEWHQFGGATGLDLAHRFFGIDSMAILAYQRLRIYGGTHLGPTEFSLTLLDTLLRGATGDQWERWDVWCNMAATGRLRVPVGSSAWREAQPSPAVREALLALLGQPARREWVVSEGETAILRRYTEQVRAVTADLRSAEQRGHLMWGLREILPFWIVFHWNRMGVGAADQQRLALAMTHVLSPKRPPT